MNRELELKKEDGRKQASSFSIEEWEVRKKGAIRTDKGQLRRRESQASALIST